MKATDSDYRAQRNGRPGIEGTRGGFVLLSDLRFSPFAQFAKRECKMENIGGFRRMLSCATIGLAVSVSPCFADGNWDASRELQRVQEMQRLLGPCDSLDPKVCFDIYRRRMEQRPEGILYNELSKALTGHRLDWPIDPPKDWNTAIDVRPKSSGLIDPSKDLTRIK
jgi:hypothetical protein